MDLIGTAKEGGRDEARRAALHQAWLEKADQAELDKVMRGMKSGWRTRRQGGLGADDEVNADNVCCAWCQLTLNLWQPAHCADGSWFQCSC